jgi:hypothetical protein
MPPVDRHNAYFIPETSCATVRRSYDSDDCGLYREAMIDDTSARVLEIRKRMMESMTDEERARFARRLAGEPEPAPNPKRAFLTRIGEFISALWAAVFLLALLVGAGWLISFWTHW